eukprot:7385601-Prymnesium_polylepis.1
MALSLKERCRTLSAFGRSCTLSVVAHSRRRRSEHQAWHKGFARTLDYAERFAPRTVFGWTFELGCFYESTVVDWYSNSRFTRDSSPQESTHRPRGSSAGGRKHGAYRQVPGWCGCTQYGCKHTALSANC